MKANNNQGFTLVELMIVVAIISILAAVAYPSYQNYVRKGHRSDGKAALLVAGQQMERFFTENMSYNSAPLSATVSPQQFYTIAFDSSPTGGTVCGATSSSTTNNTAFRLCATPVGTQASDTCGVLSLSNTGVRTPTTAGCW